MLQQYTCEFCGECFERPRNGDRVFRFCSLLCWGAQRKTGKCAERICEQCNLAFSVWPYQANDPRKRFCSKVCMNERLRVIAVRERQIPCATCGKPTPGADWRTKKARATYCSIQCRGIGMRNGKWTPCDACGDLIYVYGKRVNRGGFNYCDLTCRNDGLRQRWKRTRRGSAYQTWRRAVFTRDGYRCARCGSGAGPLHAHHIKAWRRYVDLRFSVENGATLCKSCHIDVHVQAGGFWNASITPVV